MCEECVKDEYPDRGTICLDTGVYMANLNCCINCKKNEVLAAGREESTTETTEVVTYNHICKHCDHVIATHKYTFWIEENYQEYEMECLLCGISEDSISILPDDPRKMAGLELL